MSSFLSSFFRFFGSLFHGAPRQIEIRHSIWLPTETWLDVFEFLPRRDLVRSVQPSCRRFHAIAELHVRNVHILRHLRQFLDGLESDLPEQHMDLREPGEYFRLDGYLVFYVEGHAKHNLDYRNRNKPSAASICNLLHHLPTCGDDEKEQQANGTRIIDMGIQMMSSTAAEIIECCKKLLLQSETAFDQRTFLFIFFPCAQQVPFRLDHPPTGEVLHLEEIHLSEFPGKSYYHLRRCPIADLATADQFYRDNFEEEIFFRTPVKNDGLEAPSLLIR